MHRSLAGLPADHYPPESLKFRSSIVFVHGLWTGSWCWQTWATHFCNLGWDCFAINLRGRFGQNPLAELQRLSFADCIRDLAAALKSFAFPPVVAGLNLGASLALQAAQLADVSAVVLVSPAQLRGVKVARSRSLRLLWVKYFMLIYLRRPFRIDQKDFSNYFLTGLPAGSICQRTVPDSSLLVREFFAPTAAIRRHPLTCPILVLAGSDDSIIPVASHRESADWLGADLKEYPSQGHWLLEADSETVVRNVHRWLVHTLGDKIILTDIG